MIFLVLALTALFLIFCVIMDVRINEAHKRLFILERRFLEHEVMTAPIQKQQEYTEGKNL